MTPDAAGPDASSPDAAKPTAPKPNAPKPNTPGPATRFVHEATRWTPDHWWVLEARAFDDDLAVRHALRQLAPLRTGRELTSGSESTPRALLGAVLVLSWLLPISAVFALGLGRDSSVQVGLAGVLAGTAAVIGFLALIRDRRDLASDPRSSRSLIWVHLPPSLITAWIAVPAVVRGQATGPLGLIGIAADLALGLVYLAMFAGSAPRITHVDRLLAQLDDALADLPPQRYAAVERDLDEALEAAFLRDLITHETLEAARSIALGHLGHTLAPRPVRPSKGRAGRG